MLKITKKPSSKEKKPFDFFALSVKEQEKILDRVLDKANKDQLDMVERHEKKYGKLDFQDCSN